MPRLSTLALVASTALLATSASTPNPQYCPSGAVHGVWQLPAGSQGTGQLAGLCYLGTSTTVAYTFTATLTDVPTPCLSCLEGEIAGTLDDGVGTGPDFLVHGRYRGSFLGGTGEYRAQVLTLSGAHVAGRIQGTFDDTPITPGPGTFEGRWRVCP